MDILRDFLITLRIEMPRYEWDGKRYIINFNVNCIRFEFFVDGSVDFVAYTNDGCENRIFIKEDFKNKIEYLTSAYYCKKLNDSCAETLIP